MEVTPEAAFLGGRRAELGCPAPFREVALASDRSGFTYWVSGLCTLGS